MELPEKQEEVLDKLVEEGLIKDKEQFVNEAISKKLNKSEFKKEIKKINGDEIQKSKKEDLQNQWNRMMSLWSKFVTHMSLNFDWIP